MLILARRADEAILVGDDIRIVICKVGQNGSVRVGVEAPNGLKILREELVTGEEIDVGNQNAASCSY